MMRYSTARSGLLKEALRACSTCGLSQLPIDIIEVTADSTADPDNRSESIPGVPLKIIIKTQYFKNSDLLCSFLTCVAYITLTFETYVLVGEGTLAGGGTAGVTGAGVGTTTGAGGAAVPGGFAFVTITTINFPSSMRHSEILDLSSRIFPA